jgi:hypothetical protein
MRGIKSRKEYLTLKAADRLDKPLDEWHDAMVIVMPYDLDILDTRVKRDIAQYLIRIEARKIFKRVDKMTTAEQKKMQRLIAVNILIQQEQHDLHN